MSYPSVKSCTHLFLLSSFESREATTKKELYLFSGLVHLFGGLVNTLVQLNAKRTLRESRPFSLESLDESCQFGVILGRDSAEGKEIPFNFIFII
jgi:hypothetical protein